MSRAADATTVAATAVRIVDILFIPACSPF
jgi:hypothetical protein